MTSSGDAQYRLELAQGFRDEARQDIGIKRWRSCVDNSQLAVENAGKAVLALLGPVAHTHKPADLLRQAVGQRRLLSVLDPQVRRLADIADQLGWDVHVASDYGDEVGRRSPWDLFDEPDAQHALALAEEAVDLAQAIIRLQAGP